MDSKTAVNTGIAIAIFVFGGVFFTLAQRGELLTGLLGGALIGGVSGVMVLGILSSLIKRENSNEQKVEIKPIEEASMQEVNMAIDASTGYFKFPAIGDEQIPPTYFGYWSVRWSDELARKTLEELSAGSLEGCSSYMGSYLTRLQLLALYTASYWAYAVYILGVPSECVDQMNIGLTDSIKEYRAPDGVPISQNFIELFDSFFKRSFKSIGDDFNDTSDLEGYNPYINHVAKRFNEAVEFYNFRDGKSMPELEKTFIGHIVADIPLSLFQVLKEQNLEYVG